ncbi:MAG: hypothetical protein R2705_14660 [Ilumatobacteraceae bacterium]
MERESMNVHETLGAVARDQFDAACSALADPTRRIGVVSGEATRGVALQLVWTLGALRAGVVLLDGNPVSVAAKLADLGPGDVLVAVDLRRYESWVVEVVDAAVRRTIDVIGVTDSRLSPLAERGPATFVVAGEGGTLRQSRRDPRLVQRPGRRRR